MTTILSSFQLFLRNLFHTIVLNLFLYIHYIFLYNHLTSVNGLKPIQRLALYELFPMKEFHHSFFADILCGNDLLEFDKDNKHPNVFYISSSQELRLQVLFKVLSPSSQHHSSFEFLAHQSFLQ